MTHTLVYIFRYLTWLSTWAQTRGITIVDGLLCAVPVMLVLAFIRARLIEAYYSRGVTIGGIRYTDVWRDD